MSAIRIALVAATCLAVARGVAADPVTVVALGDSITKGVRPGVKVEETFARLLSERFKAANVPGQVVNVGIGGERTDGALARLMKDVLVLKPKVVLVMYGTNDSYVDKGKSESRLSVAAYRGNLVKLVETLRARGAEPVLMTEPRWASGAKNGIGESPNVHLEKYVAACREVAKEKKIPLVDHYAHWTRAVAEGRDLRDWTTDGCHPNPRGHRELADLIWPVLKDALGPPAP